MKPEVVQARIAERRALPALVTGLALLSSLAMASAARADQIAYSCGDDICLVNPDNPAERSNLTETEGAAAQERSPAWAPGGNWIAYVGNVAGGLYDVFVLDPTRSAAEGETTNISDNDEANAEFERPPVWSPNGTRVAYVEQWWGSGKPGNDVFVSPFDGTADQIPVGQTAGGELSPSFSPDGRVVFGANVAAYIANADGTGPPTLIASSTGYEPRMSPDGKYIAMKDAGPFPYEVRIVKADGSGSYPLATPGSNAPDFEWSSDSSRLTYVSEGGQVWVAPTDGSGPGGAVPLAPGWIGPHNPSFSPDGSRVALDANPSGGGYPQILVGPADGSAPAAPITSGSMHNQEPDWKPGPGGPRPPSGNGGGSGAAGEGSGGAGGGGGGARAGKTPVRIRLAYLKAPILTPKYMTPVSIDCHAQGGHPTGKVAEFCAATASAYPTGAAARAFRRPLLATAAKKQKRKRPPLFASGKIRIPIGKAKPLKLKLSALGKRLLNAGKPLKLKLMLKITRPGAKPRNFTKTLRLKPPAKKAKRQT